MYKLQCSQLAAEYKNKEHLSGGIKKIPLE